MQQVIHLTVVKVTFQYWISDLYPRDEDEDKDSRNRDRATRKSKDVDKGSDLNADFHCLLTKPNADQKLTKVTILLSKCSAD